MKKYAVVWQLGCGICVVGGATAAVVVVPLVAWILAGGVGAAVALTMAFAPETNDEADVGPLGRSIWLIVAVCAAVLATSAYTTFLGAGGSFRR